MSWQGTWSTDKRHPGQDDGGQTLDEVNPPTVGTNIGDREEGIKQCTHNVQCPPAGGVCGYPSCWNGGPQRTDLDTRGSRLSPREPDEFKSPETNMNRVRDPKRPNILK